MTPSHRSDALGTIAYGMLAGAAGGLAEVVWIAFWASLTGADAADVARGVASVFVAGAPAGLGLAIHMALAVALGVALVAALRAVSSGWPGIFAGYALALGALAAVWMVNFLLVLPIVSPGFVHIVPFAVSLGSKLLFGLAAATVLHLRAGAPAFLCQRAGFARAKEHHGAGHFTRRRGPEEQAVTAGTGGPAG